MPNTALSKFYVKPALIIFSQYEPTSNSASTQFDLTGSLGTGKFLYISDDNREALQVRYERIEYKQRTINGTMRSYFVNQKRTFQTSWTDFPSRRITNNSIAPGGANAKVTSDRFAAGQDILKWYETYKTDFWLTLVYDGPTPNTTDVTNVGTVVDNSSRTNTSGYAEKVRVMFDAMDYTIKKRGQYNDLWDVSMSLVEV